MSIIDVENLMQKSLENLSLFCAGREVYGQPIVLSEKVSVIPLTKTTIGFVTGGAEITKRENRLDANETPIGALGGGITSTPIGFLLVSDGRGTMIKADGDNGVEKWLDIISDAIKNLKG